MPTTFTARPCVVIVLFLLAGFGEAFHGQPMAGGDGRIQHQYNHQRLLGRDVTSSSPATTRQTESMVSSKLSTTALSMQASTPPPYPVRVAVLGGGNFGLALASVCGRKGIPTTMLVRNKEVEEAINNDHRHPRYMTDLELPPSIRATTNPPTALSDATYIIHAVPVQYSREFLNSIAHHVPHGTPVLSASKGIETSNLGFMADILEECLGDDRPYAFLSGPSFAREICEGVATAVVVASKDLLLSRDLASLLSDDSFRVFTSMDVTGVEVGGAVKNVIALAAGMCEGLGLGTNAMSGLVTRGCGEMRRLGLTFGAKPSTIAGLSGEWYPYQLLSTVFGRYSSMMMYICLCTCVCVHLTAFACYPSFLFSFVLTQCHLFVDVSGRHE